MLRLHGFSASNYYNIVKLALLEKGLSFEEVTVYTGAGPNYRPDFLSSSPLGKVPCLETEHGYLTESRCILDYIERTQTGPALYPRGGFEQAKLLELTQIIDLYLELSARRLLPNYFARKPPPERIANEVIAGVTKGANALRELAKFDSYLLGEQFTAADIAGVIHFPVVRTILKKVLGCDPLAEVPGLTDYLARLEQRPTVQRVRADQTANYPAFVAHLQLGQVAAATPASTGS
jgi:glutathione S-transferase